MVDAQPNSLQLERADTHNRRSLIVAKGREYLGGTALVENKPWTPQDPTQVREFLVATAPFAHPNVYPSYWDHVLLASLYAMLVAKKTPSIGLDPNEAEALGLLHDVGRLAIANRYLRNDLVGESIFARIGMRRELADKLPSVPAIIGVRVPFISSAVHSHLDNVSPVRRLFDVADNIGKIGSDGKLFDIRTMLAYDTAQPQRYTGGMWPSERAGKKALTEGNKQKFAIELLLQEVAWLQEKHGINFDELLEEVAQEFQKPDHQEFLLSLRDAQETLDPNVDNALGRPNIEVVVFESDPEVPLSIKRGTIITGSSPPDLTILLKHPDINPKSILFVGNNEDATRIARANHMRGFTFRGNPFKNLSAAQRLRKELQKAGLI